MSRVRIAMAQINQTVGGIGGNVSKIEAGMDRAREVGADLVLFPELTVTGYPPEDLLLKPAFLQANLAAVRSLVAKSRGLTAIVGFVDVDEDVYNAAAVLHDGAWAHTYRKQYLPNYGVFDEDRYFQSGADVSVLRRGDLRFGVSICEDIWYPAGPPETPGAAGRRAAAGQHLGLPLPRGQELQPGTDAAYARCRQCCRRGLLQHGGWAG